MLAVVVNLSAPEMQWLALFAAALLSGGSVGAVLRHRMRTIDAVQAEVCTPDEGPTLARQVRDLRADAAHTRRELDRLATSVDLLTRHIVGDRPQPRPRPRPVEHPWPRPVTPLRVDPDA